ncbi:MAG TPA: dTDP-4-dehydrorhamnose 3,5-epimerase [Bacteroidota bacterium]|nr:dTDP-4-dehydrorhamnose 3,5-epimerase [Bacteroidota bacterium]
MAFSIESKHLGGDVVVVKPTLFADNRGFFSMLFHKETFAGLGLPTSFVQDNWSRSRMGVVRGLHFQWDPPMGKMMYVVRGKAFLVAVDIRKNSPTLGQYFSMTISSDDPRLLWAPAGFARGFCALSDEVDLQYKCTGIYNPKCESAVRWNDPDIGIRWPLETPIMSERDAAAQPLKEWLASPNSSQF